MDLLSSLGRFHILILHLPIGFLLLAALMEISTARNSSLRNAVHFTLFWGMITAVLASALGYLLSLEGGYDDQLLSWHKWLGFSTAVFSVGLYLSRDKPFFRPFFILTILLLLITSHFGGSLTHGKDFLFKKSDVAGPDQLPANIDSAYVFDDLILPVLKDKCVGCHNPTKKKGGLILNTREDIQKGGDNGACIVPGDPGDSKLISYLNLPDDDDLHMPPDGKKQLTDIEKQLLEWWVQAGAPFEKMVAECTLPGDLRTALEEKARNSGSPLAALELNSVDPGRLQQLRKEGIGIFPIDKSNPFLMVNLSGRKDLSAGLLNALKKVREHIVELDLRNTNIDDDLLAQVEAFPHLNRLYLSQTSITDKGIEHLANLEFLEYLNLYETGVSDRGMESLKHLPHLKSIYLWQTGVTENGLAVLTANSPDLFINTGIENDSIFGEVGLKPPKFNTETQLFKERMEVELIAGFGNASIYYTLDGSHPDTNSTRYEGPVLLESTSEIKAIAYKEGWSPSEPASRLFTKVRYKPVSIEANEPHPRYAGEGISTLIDFSKGDNNFRSGAWLGYEGKHLNSTLDLGRITDISRITVGAFEDVNSWIFYPVGIKVSLSEDGRVYREVADHKYPVAEGPTQPEARNFSLPFEATQARYVRIKVTSQLKNPDWHPAPGEPCWLFVDEILVE